MRIRGSSPLLAGAVLAASVAAAAGEPMLATGDVVRVDLTRKRLTMREASRQRVELSFVIDSATRIMAAGRDLSLAEIRPGDPVAVVWEADEAGRRRALLVRAGRLRAPAPEPTPSAAPSPSPPPAPSASTSPDPPRFADRRAL